MGGTIAIVDSCMQLLTGLGIPQAGSNIRGWVISDGSVTESGYFAATPENVALMVTWMTDWARQPKAKYIVCTGK